MLCHWALGKKDRHPAEITKAFPWHQNSYTGHIGKFVDDEEFYAWLNDPKLTKGNIGIRLGNPVRLNEDDPEE